MTARISTPLLFATAAAAAVALPLLPAAAAGAPLACPSAAQYAWHEQERIQFVCLDPCTWQGREYDNHSTTMADMKLEKLDVDQWLTAAEAWGAKEILLVCKHTGGFCWWPTETTDYSVKGIAWQGGKGNLVKDVADACRRHGLAMGVYIYPDDPRFAGGMGRSGKTDDPAKQEEWNRLFRRQWEEVLTICGSNLVRELWFDGSCQIPVRDLFERLAPQAVILQSPAATIRWVGNEAGTARDPNWNTLKKSALESGVATQEHSDPDGDAWAPVECDTTLYDHDWFWAAANERKRKSLDHLMNLYVQSAGRGSVLLLNSTPNTDGLIPAGDMARYRAFGEAIARNFGRPLGVVTNVAGLEAELDLGGPRRVNCSDLWEDYRLGHRIRAYVIEGRVNGASIRLAQGTAAGRRKLDLFAPALADRVRLRVTAAAGAPTIRRFQVHCADDALAQAHVPPVSQGQPATASSCYSRDYAAALMVNGSPQTRWNASESDPEPWVELDLGRPRKLARATGNELSDRITRFRIEARTRTNEDWRVVHEGSRMGASWAADFERVTARFVRLHILSSTNKPAAPTLSEFRLFDRPEAWEAAGTWAGGAADVDLSASVNEPGEYAVQFADAAGRPVVCQSATLLLDGAESAAALRGTGTDTLTVTRSQVVTAEAATRLRAVLRAEPGARGTVRIRP